jgi:hypothetical protein
MNFNLTEDQKNECKGLFDSFLEISDRAKEISEEKKAVVEHFSRVTETKKGVASKILRAMQKKYEGGELDENEIVEAVEVITT